MTSPIDNLDELLTRVTAGRLDDLTPEQVAALEAHLNSTPAAAERLANVVPAPDAHLSKEAPLPSEADWDEVWERIDSATPAREPTPRVFGRVFRFWRPLVAAAACLLLMVVLRVMLSPLEPPWEIRLSDVVVVHELEVFGNASAFVAYSEDGNGAATIWVLEENEEQEGA